MDTTASKIAGQVLLWGARIVGPILLYLFIRYLRPNIFYKGWGSLQPTYSLASAAPPADVQMHPISLRVGNEHYSQTAYVGLGPAGLYLRRPAPLARQRVLYIPYAQVQLQSPPTRTGPLNLPVYGIFKVDGVEIWLDNPYATDLIAHLSPPAP